MEVRKLKPDELQHHGVKGQKWGIRRYQNYDGTLKNAKGMNSKDSSGTSRTVYTNRKKKTTGNSKGVKKRDKIASQTFNFSKNQSNYTTHFDSTMKKNTVTFKGKSTASGAYVTDLNFKDKDSASDFLKIVNSIYENSSTSVADQTLAILISKYGELEFDASKLDDPKTVSAYQCFTNLSEKDQLMPGLALTSTSSNNSSDGSINSNHGYNGMPSSIINKQMKQVGYNGMPSNVVKYVKGKSNKTTNHKHVEIGKNYISNGAPSNLEKPKKYIRLNAPRRTSINANPGTNGMPTNIPVAAYSSWANSEKKRKKS